MQQASLLALLTQAASARSTLGLAGVMPEVRATMNRVAGGYSKGRKMLVDAINGVAKRESVPLTRYWKKL